MVVKFTEYRIVKFNIEIFGIEYENKTFSLNKHGYFKLKKTFEWDGATPKIRLFGRILGTPDGSINPKTGKPTYYYASMVHDAINQSNCPITYKQWNDAALFLMKRDGHKLWRIYNFGNRLFGRFFGRWKKTKWCILS